MCRGHFRILKLYIFKKHVLGLFLQKLSYMNVCMPVQKGGGEEDWRHNWIIRNSYSYYILQYCHVPVLAEVHLFLHRWLKTCVHVMLIKLWHIYMYVYLCSFAQCRKPKVPRFFHCLYFLLLGMNSVRDSHIMAWKVGSYMCL